MHKTFYKKDFNEYFLILSPWIKSWRLYNGYTQPLEDNRQYLTKKKTYIIFFIQSKLYFKDMRIK